LAGEEGCRLSRLSLTPIYTAYTRIANRARVDCAAMARITEAQIGEAVLEVLDASPNGTATIRSLKERIPHHVNLSAEDLAPSPTRNGEAVWEQQVRNLVSHRTAEGNIIAEGLADYRPGRLTITNAGRLHVQHRRR
jgi:hypothetical protein